MVNVFKLKLKTFHSHATKEKPRLLPSPSGSQVVPKTMKLVERERLPLFPKFCASSISQEHMNEKGKGGGSVVSGKEEGTVPGQLLSLAHRVQLSPC